MLRRHINFTKGFVVGTARARTEKDRKEGRKIYSSLAASKADRME